MQRHNTKPKDSPPLPQPYGYKLSSRTFGRIPLFTADQMRAYVLADRAARVERREAMAAEMVAAKSGGGDSSWLALYRQGIEDALDRLASVPPADTQGQDQGQGAWISVKDRLPEPQQSVAFVISGVPEPSAYLNGRVLGGTYHGGPYGGFGVPGMTVSASHWQPLPEPPTTGEQT